MRYTLALAVLLALAGCHRRSSEVMPGADAEARRAAAQQTLDDLSAADAAAHEALPAAARTAQRSRTARSSADDANDNRPGLTPIDNAAQPATGVAPR